MSRDAMMILVFGGGFILPILLLGLAVSHFTSKSERQFYEEYLDLAIKQYLRDTTFRRELTDEDRNYFCFKINSRLKKRIQLLVGFSILMIFAYALLIYRERKWEYLVILAFLVVMDLIFILLEVRKKYKNRHTVQEISKALVLKGHIYKYIRAGKYSVAKGSPTIVLVVFYDYISEKYQTYETKAYCIAKKEVQEGIEYIDLICEEKEDSIQVLGVLS